MDPRRILCSGEESDAAELERDQGPALKFSRERADEASEGAEAKYS